MTSVQADSDAAVTLQLNWKHQFSYAGYYAAAEKGFYREAGLDVTFIELKQGTNPVEEVLNGRATYGIRLSGLILERMQGKPVVMLSNDFKHSPITIITRPEIRTPSDLSGKRVMGTAGSHKDAELAYMLKVNGLTQGDIDWVASSFNIRDLFTGKADGIVSYSTSHSFWLDKTGIKYKTFNPSDDGADFYGNSLFTSEDEIRQHPVRTRKFVEASIRGWNYALAHPGEIVDLILSKYSTGTSREELECEAETIRKMMLPEIYTTGSIDPGRIRRIADMFVELGMADANYDLGGFILDGPDITSLSMKASLTENEREYLMKNRKIRIAFMDSFAPFSYLSSSGHQGFSRDYYNLLSRKTGLIFEPEFGSWASNIRKFREGEVDLIDGISYRKEREGFTLFTRPYYTIPQALFTRDDFGIYTGIDQLFQKRIGINKGTYFKNVLSGYKNIDLMELEGTESLMRGLSIGQLDGVITNMGHGLSVIRDMDLQNIRSVGEISLEGVRHEDLRIGVRVDKPVLFSILNKGMESISGDKLAALRDKWFFSMPDKTGKKLNLTDKEKQFLKQHPVITVANEENWPPFDFQIAGEPSGFSIDLLKMISERTGLTFNYVSGYTWNETIGRFYNREIDVLHSLSKNEERGKYGLFSNPFYHTPHVLITGKNANPVHDIRELYGKTLAMPAEWAVAKYLSKNHPEIRLLNVDGTVEALDAISREKAFGTIEQEAILLYFLKKYGYNNLKMTYRFKEFDNLGNAAMYIAVRKDWPVLQRLVNKAMIAIPPGDIARLEMKWFGQTKSTFSKEQQVLELSKQERAFLKRKKKITFCIGPDRMPFEGRDEENIKGMISEFIKLFEQRLKIPFEYVPTQNQESSLEKMKNGECDVIPMVSKTPLNLENMHLSEPYLSHSVAIIVRENYPFITGLDDLSGEDVGIVKHGNIWETVPKQYPLVSYRNLSSVREGLLSVSSGKITALIIDLPVATYNIRQMGLTNLKVAGHLDGVMKLHVGTRQNLSELHTIWEKIIATLTREEIDTIYRKWISIRFEHRFDYTILWKVLAATAAILIGVVCWIRKLSGLNKQITEANIKLEQLSVTDRLTGLYNRLKLDEVLNSELKRVIRYKIPLSLILVDVDHFKAVNDTYGHQVGDAVLCGISDTIAANIRSVDTCGRWGGEEFLIVCPETDIRGAEILAENLRQTIENRTFEIAGSCTGSFGITEFKYGDTEAEMIARADTALYRAKSNGRNRVERD